MSKHSIIRVFFILIIFVVSSCLFDEDRIDIPEEITQTKIKIDTFSQPNIIIINKNWDAQLKDSIIKNYNSSIIVSKADILRFITIEGNTIDFNIDNINSINPIIIFNTLESPILTSLSRFNILYNYYFPEEKEIIATENQITIESTLETPKKPKKIDREEINKLESRKAPKLEKSKSNTNIPKLPLTRFVDIQISYPLINNNQALKIRFDNDFWDYTDYYYTNGAAIGYTHPVFASSPISRILVSNGKSGIDYYGLQVVQHMYTGLQPKVDSIVEGDRPWSAYSTLGQYLISYDSKHKIKHYSEFNIGLIGPESGGGFIQNFVHVILPNNSAPEGWHNQIAADIIIDYQYKILKDFYSAKNFESYLIGAAQLGTLRDNISWGFGLRYGKFVPFYQDESIYHRKKKLTPYPRKFHYNLVFNIETKIIAYDATLQGGMFNKESVYVLPSGAINRFIVESYAGFELSYGQWELQFLQFWKSREFHTGEDHKYASVRLNIAF